MTRLHHAGRAISIVIAIISTKRPLEVAQRGERSSAATSAMAAIASGQTEANALLEEHAAARDAVAVNLGQRC
ncbi:hypothetical protein [Bradyrhizobium sp.]|uniref:hypothetical protein n=1 Tax=Bradyrhizobium sp. TaxID=376 RepID=UPI001DD54037|nr:hypothetical protein [Bradyrhizobium sp.]MBV8697263.1 hypothetical protein [Bradyrhizobium sp.]MBV8922299.1 hypothetical protein [Bradyrhizobium sp.]MBV9980478.1 hypothetical protein [Bradyrhizobium sp.]